MLKHRNPSEHFLTEDCLKIISRKLCPRIIVAQSSENISKRLKSC